MDVLEQLFTPHSRRNKKRFNFFEGILNRMYTGVYFFKSAVCPGGIMSFGTYVNGLRIKSKKTLWRFCRENSFDPTRWSKVERDVNLPPRDEVMLTQLAKYFGLKPQTEEWNRFMREARTSRDTSAGGKWDDKEAESFLPAFICTADGNDVKESEMRKLTQKIKESNTPDAF